MSKTQEEFINDDIISEKTNKANCSSTSNNIEEILPPKINHPSHRNIECHWVIGQLAWAKVGNFPFWPCVVTLDPVLMIYHKLKGKYLNFIHLIKNFFVI